MNKKLQLILLAIILVIIGGGLYFFFKNSLKTPARTITYLVSNENSQKYCNGADMDSAGYEKTITTEQSTNIVEANLTKIQIAKAVINAATTGMCREAMNTLDITEDNGTIYIPPINAWAGVSITMCSCKPLVEVNLLRIPGINKVVWSMTDSKNIKNSPIACTQEAKLCPDGSYVGRTGANCEFTPCPQKNILPFDSGVEGEVLLGPTCPVMRVGDTACADKPYATTIQIIAVGSPKSSPFATVNSDKEGAYKIMLPPGDYALQPVGGSVLPRCETKNITIIPSKIIKADLACDSGIR